MIRKKLFATSIFLTLLFTVNAQNLDIDIAKSINPSDPNSGYWRATSGSVFIISAGATLGLFVEGLVEKNETLKKKSYLIAGGIAINLVITEILKISIDRQRPAEKYPLDIFPYKEIHGKSMPSGHTSTAFATAAGLSVQFKKWYVTVPAYLWAASVGYSRIYLGVHYPSDVLAGAIVGTGSAYLACWLNRKLFKKKK